jgi:hypothetical protein
VVLENDGRKRVAPGSAFGKTVIRLRFVGGHGQSGFRIQQQSSGGKERRRAGGFATERQSAQASHVDVTGQLTHMIRTID